MIRQDLAVLLMDSVNSTEVCMKQNVKRVLIVEDEQALLFGLKKLLQSEFIIIDDACSLKEAELFLNNNSYQAVITDLRLSGADVVEGYDVIRIAKKLQPDCKIMVITAYAENGEKFKVAEGNVDHFLEKPVSPKKLKELLDAI